MITTIITVEIVWFHYVNYVQLYHREAHNKTLYQSKIKRGDES